ncbi:argonaute family, partial [Rhizoctonia solani]
MTLHLPRTKTHQITGKHVHLASQRDGLSPITAMVAHLRANASIPGSHHIFAYSTRDGSIRCLTREDFLVRCNEVWITEGHPSVFGHSFRIGGTHAYLAAGVPSDVVKKMGRWRRIGVLRPPARNAFERRRAFRHSLPSSSLPLLPLRPPAHALWVSSLGGLAPVAPRFGVPPLRLPPHASTGLDRTRIYFPLIMYAYIRVFIHNVPAQGPVLKWVGAIASYVVHPPPGAHGLPSFSGVVGSLDSGLVVGMIHGLEDTVYELIGRHFWWKNNQEGRAQPFPERITYYRAGIADNEVAQLLSIELPAIQGVYPKGNSPMISTKDASAACKRHNIQTKVTVVLVGKQHHTRFFPTHGMVDSTGNCPAGTVVDSM